ncbi:type II toxin-antitoxin system death-on-curing family toxin [Maribius pontilimi]|uniref:Type II toxin-antitoxin system death-on-curing family toxin n=1 Tax=Palleronia pontilimi TaxID=1964209 RepID=A0A934MDS9_9RHOB|nr:type II toxin-antitoxin system death-on-curing family toxin [Palleronia pontilimi]MBJ3762706.1 type II toxin-antitoxin system death-on-curing family toxin [Palleronia pontilimi]
MTDAPRWVPFAAIKAIHDRMISRHGGTPGMRDEALLEMACGRPLNLHAYGQPDLFDLAAAYAFGIAKAHAFIDGNKRTAFQTCFVFLYLNGQDLDVPNAEVVAMMEDLAQSRVPEAEFASWLRAGAAAR